jgi:alanine racemase
VEGKSNSKNNFVLPSTLNLPPSTSSGTWIEIRLDHLLSNLHAVKQFAPSSSQIMAVVKANAYGHGLLETARALSGHVNYLGIASLYEALELREHGIETPIFLFGRLFGAELASAVKSNLTLSVSSLEEAQAISETAIAAGKPGVIHVKVDTGMGRLGIPLRSTFGVIEQIAGLPGLVLDGIYTHLPTAEKNDGFKETQAERFTVLLHALETRGIRFRVRHLANSAANLLMPMPTMNLIRPGLILYGISPDKGIEKAAAFSPVLSLRSRIILLKRLEAGDSVGYGRDFVAHRSTTIATLPIGYSHGYPFHLSNQAWVLYRGKRYPLAGRVSMDYITVDLGNAPAQTGDEITLIGEDGAEHLRAEDLAAWAGTIPYEIVTRLSARIPRFYL